MATTPASNSNEAIAVIGLAGRFPGAANITEFWSLLEAGENAVREIPSDRWDWRAIHAHRRGEPGRTYTRWGGFLDAIDCFDPLFFGISPAEAEAMDPQERLFLETAWATIEDAGLAANKLRGKKVGVFAGAMNPDYEWLSGRAHALGHTGDAHSAYWSIANRVSYVLDLQGPSMAVDTACSSSLTAIHLACESLRRNECDMALAGGVNLISGSMHYQRLCALSMLSDGGVCRPFGDGADGMVDGEGVGAVLLKPLSQALADGDRIDGVIRGSAMNSDGKTGGYTVPNPNAQADLIETALRRAGVDARSISYVEAHGTGTPLGDPVELSGLTQAFRRFTDDAHFCAVGSVKSNIGHLESAAGIAGLAKVLTQLRHGKLVPSLHAETLNPKLDIDGSPFFIQRDNRTWERPNIDGTETPRRAGLSSFGAGGSNVHLIVEEAPGQQATSTHRSKPEVIVLSARDDARLREHAANLLTYFVKKNNKTCDPLTVMRDLVRCVLGIPTNQLDVHETFGDLGLSATQSTTLTAQINEAFGTTWDTARLHTLGSLAACAAELMAPSDRQQDSLANIAHTLQTGRDAMRHRLAFVAKTVADAKEKLDAYLQSETVEGLYTGQAEEASKALAADTELDAVAKHWVVGGHVDWAVDRSTPVCLPTYPFARERYWIRELDGQKDTAPTPTKVTPSQPESSPAQLAKQSGYRVAIIGGGPAGLVTAKCLMEEGHVPVILEKTDRVGGIWAIRDQAPRGTYGSTRLQTSKYTSLFSDFPAGDDIDIFPSVPQLDGYFNAYADFFDLRTHLRTNTEVSAITPLPDGRWRVTADGCDETFDAVATATGMLWTPQIPKFSGLDRFQGETLHSSAYFDPTPFKDQKVLVIGNGVSGMDISAELTKAGAKVGLSIRTPMWIIPRMIGFVPNDCSLSAVRRSMLKGMSAEQTIEGWRQAMPDFMDAYERSGLMPNHPVHGNLLNVNDHLVYQVVEGNVTVYPEIEGFTTNGVRFGDGREKDFDTVIFCTGFKLPNVPYFPDISPADLYKNHFHPDHPTMAVMGHYPSTLGCFSTLELGARWFAMALSGKVSLPDKAEMLQAVMADKARVSGKGFISKDPTLHSVIPVDTPLDNIWFAEQIGAFPNPTEDWSLYWELINLPPIPSIYRLTGPHAWDGARAHLDSVRERLFSRQDDDKLIPIKHDMLSRLGEEVVRRLHESGQISADEAEAALTLCRQVA